MSIVPLFDYSRTVELIKAIDALQALAHEHRLRVFRILIRWGELGLSAGDIAEALGIPPSSLSFHLGRLERAGLIQARRTGRQIHYSINGAGTRALLAYLYADCCHGHPELCGDLTSLSGDNEMSKENHPYNVLFLCTGNSARSIIAECILDRVGSGRFKAYSAGSHPKGEVHPFALQLLRNTDYDVSQLRSKDVAEFEEPGAPEIDFVFTLCDNAATEVCPVWPGQPMTAHWGVPDPASARGSDAEIAAMFAETYRMLDSRISIFHNLPIASLDKLSLQKQLDEIGQSSSAMDAPQRAKEATWSDQQR